MFLTPKDIHDKTFKRSFKGYDENEVDEFLDLIIKEFNIMIDENERLRQELMAKPIVQEYSSASAGEVKRLEAMLAQAIEALQKNKQANAISEEENNAKKAEEYAREQEKNAKLNEFKKSLESYKSNFELLMEEQRKQLNEKYSEMIQEIDSLTDEKTVVSDKDEADFNQLLEYSAPPAAAAVNETRQEQPQQAAAEKPPVFYHSENPAGMIEKTILTIEKQTQPDPSRQPVQPQFIQPEPVVQTPQFTPGEPASQRPLYTQPEPVAQQPLYTQPEPVAQQPLYAQPEPAAQPPQYAQPEPVIQKPQFFQNAPQPVQPPVQTEPPKYQGIVKQQAADPNEQNPVASDNRFKPNYSEYAWLYQERDGLNKAADANMDISFRNPREKEELKRLIDEVID